jgi:hypothetical protein
MKLTMTENIVGLFPTNDSLKYTIQAIVQDFVPFHRAVVVRVVTMVLIDLAVGCPQ